MKKIAVTLLAGTAALGLMAGSALAQAQGQGNAQAPGVAAGAGAGVGLGAGQGNAMGAGQGQDNFGQLIASINGLSATTSSIASITTAPVNIEVISTADLSQGNNVQALDNALDRNGTQVADLRTALNANATLKAALEAKNVNLDEVVAVDIGANGDLVVYTRPATP